MTQVKSSCYIYAGDKSATICDTKVSLMPHANLGCLSRNLLQHLSNFKSELLPFLIKATFATQRDIVYFLARENDSYSLRRQWNAFTAVITRNTRPTTASCPTRFIVIYKHRSVAFHSSRCNIMMLLLAKRRHRFGLFVLFSHIALGACFTVITVRSSRQISIHPEAAGCRSMKAPLQLKKILAQEFTPELLSKHLISRISFVLGDNTPSVKKEEGRKESDQFCN